MLLMWCYVKQIDFDSIFFFLEISLSSSCGYDPPDDKVYYGYNIPLLMAVLVQTTEDQDGLAKYYKKNCSYGLREWSWYSLFKLGPWIHHSFLVIYLTNLKSSLWLNIVTFRINW